MTSVVRHANPPVTSASREDGPRVSDEILQFYALRALWPIGPVSSDLLDRLPDGDGVAQPGFYALAEHETVRKPRACSSVDRASASGAEGRRFESCRARTELLFYLRSRRPPRRRSRRLRASSARHPANPAPSVMVAALPTGHAASGH